MMRTQRFGSLGFKYIVTLQFHSKPTPFFIIVAANLPLDLHLHMPKTPSVVTNLIVSISTFHIWYQIRLISTKLT